MHSWRCFFPKRDEFIALATIEIIYKWEYRNVALIIIKQQNNLVCRKKTRATQRDFDESMINILKCKQRECIV